MNRPINHKFLPLLPPQVQRFGEGRGFYVRVSLLPESGLAITSSAAPVDGGAAHGRKRIGFSSVASPSPRPSPLGRGRIVHRAFADAGRLESSRRGMRGSLSLRERARVRGNETPPTKTDERVFQAQLDQLPESGLAITSSAAPVDGGAAHGRKRIGFSSVASPSPRPSPLGRGRIVHRAFADAGRLESSRRGMRGSLSLRERARVRGNETPPTKTDERVFQAQLDQLPESGLAITSSAAPVDGGAAHGRKRIGFSSVASPSPRPSPLGRGRIVHRAFADAGRLESSRRGMRGSLSLRERARVRGNETPPTKTDERVFQAQLDQLPESGLAITSSAAPVDGGGVHGRKRIGFSSVASPSPRPSPLGRGRIVHRAFADAGRLESSRRGMRGSLSLRERARVRGNETPPTKTDERVFQAQLDQLPESGLAITSSAAPVDGGGVHGRKRIGVSSVASPSPRPSPLGRGRIVRRAFADAGRLESSRRGMRGSLSLRERARVRGNETPPTKTDERVFQAQLDQLPESGLAITSSAAPVDGGGVHGRKRIGVSSVASPSPRPSPLGRGRIVRRAFADAGRLESSRRGMRGSLSLRERARVRGDETPPTKTDERVFQAQLDQLPESGLAITSSAAPVDGGGVHGRKRIGVSSVASPSPRPSPLGRGRIVRRAFADAGRLESSRRGMRGSLSLRERARVRGNETPPTKTDERVFQAQLDQLPESGLAITSSAAPVDGGGVHGRKRIGVSSVASPSPRPSPLGRGRIVRRAFADAGRLESSRRGMRGSLSLRERARVRGNETPPTKTDERVFQAQLDQLPESGLAITSSAAPVEGGGTHGRKRIGFSSVASPSPRPSPPRRGRGRIVRRPRTPLRRFFVFSKD